VPDRFDEDGERHIRSQAVQTPSPRPEQAADHLQAEVVVLPLDAGRDQERSVGGNRRVSQREGGDLPSS